MADLKNIKLCECGCGRPAPISRQTNNKLGYKAGQPQRFIRGHCVRVQPSHRRTHGKHGTPEYICWKGLRRRCHDPNEPSWPNYGGRGIRVCKRWGNFDNFLADMGERPSPQHSIDRINNDGHYEPGNCRWATRKTQNNNRRVNILITAFGESKTLSEWARQVGIHKATIRSRLAMGWSVENSLTIQPSKNRDLYGRFTAKQE